MSKKVKVCVILGWNAKKDRDRKWTLQIFSNDHGIDPNKSEDNKMGKIIVKCENKSIIFISNIAE